MRKTLWVHLFVGMTWLLFGCGTATTGNDGGEAGPGGESGFSRCRIR